MIEDITDTIGGLFHGLADVAYGLVSGLVDALASLVAQVLSFLPDAADLGLSTSSGWIRAYGLLDTFLPLHEALGYATILAGVITAGILWRLAVTIYHLIPKPFVGT